MPLFGPPNIEKLEAKGDIQGILKALDDGDPSIRTRAVLALGRFDYDSDLGPSVTNQPGLQDLLRVLKARVTTIKGKAVVFPRDEDPEVRAAAAAALGSLGIKYTLPSLLDASTVADISGDASLRAFETVGKKHPGAAGSILTRRLFAQYDRWASDETRTEVVNRMSPGFVAEILLASIYGDSMDHFVDVVETIAQAGSAAVEPALGALSSEHAMRRRVAACVLGKVLDERAVEPMTEALDDEDGQIRSYAARALARLGDGDAQQEVAEDMKLKRPSAEPRRKLP